jgi:hypothetical protein
MPHPSKPTGHLALCTLAWILSAAGIVSGLTGCVIPGTSTFALRSGQWFCQGSRQQV